MTTITLHDYLRKIRQLLDENQFSEATTHCRHILEKYPRHVETYRVLAKALLEQRRYEDAADLFQRVLSADPNDLVSHVGLADVYKQESLLDQSLWHLERAFELEPYNHIIQDELRHLYTRYNDVRLERIPLNQGALARIYLREELYGQAVSELRQALGQNGDRIDLEVVLAEALWRDGQRVDAAEVCQRILEQLPNCIMANAILADVWLQADRAGEAQQYLRRVQALTQVDNGHLDPETAVGHAFSMKGALALPDDITLEMLEMVSETAAPAAPTADWVSEVTFSGEVAEETEALETEAEYEYDWLTGLDEEAEPERGESEFEDVAGLFGEDEPLDLTDETAAELEVVDTASELPSWLSEGTETDAFTAEEIPDWLSQDAVRNETAFEEGAAESAEMPDWLADASNVDDFEPMEVDSMLASEWFSEEGDDEVEVVDADDDWLAALARDTGELPEPQAAGEEELWPAEFADWVAKDRAGTDYDDEVTDWLLGSDHIEQDELEEDMAGIPVDDSNKMDSSPQDVPEPEDEVSDDLDDAMTWLEALTDQQDEPGPSVIEELASEELPDWLADLSGSTDSDDLVEASAEGMLDSVDEDIPEWLRASSLDDELLGLERESGPLKEPAEETSSSDEEELSFLDRIASGEGVPIDEPPTQVSMATPETPADEDDTEVSDWLSELDREGQDESAEGLGWLDQLAAGADTPVEQMPTLEWPHEPDEEEPTLEWLSQMAAVPDETPVDLELTPTEEELDSGYETAEADTVVEVPEDLDDAMAWLEELAAQQGAPVEELPTVANVLETDMGAEVAGEESAPEELPLMAEAEAEPEAAEEETAEPFADVPDDLDDAMAWLEELAAKQGVPLDELPGLSGTRDEATGEPELEIMAAEVEEELVVEETLVSAPKSDEKLVEAEIDLDEAMAWLEDLVGQQDEPAEMGTEVEDLEEQAVSDQDEVTMIRPPTMEASAEPETGTVQPELVIAHDELEEALDWLEQVALEEGAFAAAAPVDIDATDDELEEALDWLEQVALVEAPALSDSEDELFDVPDDPEAALAWLEQLAAEGEAEAEVESEVEVEWNALAEAEETVEVVETERDEMSEEEEISETVLAETPEAFIADSSQADEEEGELELDFLTDMPDDPDEAMAWLEKLAARQGAPLEELPSISGEDEEHAMPDSATQTRLEAEADLVDGAEVAEDEDEAELVEVEEQPEAVSEDESAEGFAPAEEEAAGMEVLPVADETDWLEGLSDADVTGWLEAEEQATVISSEESAPARATGPLVEAPRQQRGEADYEVELDAEDDSLVLAETEPATSALALDETQLGQAHQALAEGDYDEALRTYQSLVTRGEGLITLISDLEMAVNEYPQPPLLRRVLGDAYMRNGQLQKALETYRQTLDQL